MSAQGLEGAEPNLTPMLDMVFQLVTFFMLVINFGPLSHPWFPTLFVWSFPVMFTLMVLMRFGL